MSQISYPCLFFSYMMLVPFLIPRCSSSDCLVDGSKISDDSSQITLVSPGKVFELGFFTPDGSFSNNRYLGIWYYRTNPRIIVWVANREKPLPETNGYVAVRDGKVEILDKNNFTFWKTNYVPSVSSAKLCLDDHGNLVLSSSEGNPILWQSFDHPTDTILPGMRLNGSLNLTSWKNGSNPAPGESLLLLQPGKDPTMIIKETGYSQYWDSGADPIARIPSLLIDVHGEISLRNNTRLVMNSTGQIQWWKWGSESGWSLFWWEPKDRCSFDTVCGNFGSCNGNSGLPCKCLPGFKPSLLQEWNEGCFSGGCVPESGFPCQRPNSFNDTFLRLPMMKVEAECRASTEDNCEDQCLRDCTCVAYSYDLTNCSGAGTPTGKRCSIWYNQLPRLQEEYSQGITLYVRTPSSGIGSTSRDCNPCGAYAIPYPLSTDETKCGDSSYSNFNCNSETGQVNFSTTTGTFRVTLINPDTKSFTIQVMDVNSCDNIHSSVLSSNKSLPFFVRECTVYKDKPLIQLRQPFIEVDIGWQPPPEPSCSVSSDCVAWPHTSCKAAKMATRRCICGPKFRWDGSKLKCTRVHFPFEAVVPCIAVVLVISILCGVFFAYRKRERKIAEKQGSIKFEGDDTEGLDVPLFGWGSILSATNNFADANKLGTGGFGSVYRGKLPDGQEIAVKRLSSVSMQGVTEFRTEVVLIARLQHRNLVRLLGYCVKADEKILVYEYMRNGSLDSCLFDRTFSAYLDWEKRFDIIVGIARGLVYLHQDSRLRIIHRDLKPSNILLDEELNPKISDFGVARIVEGKETEANTNKVVGTYGYMSPEYALEGFFSFKSDVFSFGVVVLETVSGRRNARTSAFEPGLSRLSLLGHAWKLWTEDRGLEFVDPALKESCNPDEVLRCIYVGLLCVQSDPADRPTMPTIVLMLSNGESTMSHSLPKKPAYFTRTSTSETASSSSLGCTSSFSNMITMSTEGR